MELRQLRYFLAVAEELHFNRAAQRLHMAQSPLSRQIKQLEDNLGVTLFQRTPRQVRLTEAGRLFVAKARAVLAAAEEARRTALQAEAGKIGRLSLGVTSLAAYTVFPTILRRFRTAFPSIDLSLRTNTLTPGQVEALASDRLDIGVIRPRPSERDFGLLTIDHDNLVAALPADHPLCAQDAISPVSLADLPFVMFSRRLGSSLSDAIMDAFYAARAYPRIAQEVDDIATMLLLVAAGEGVSLVPGLSRKFGVADVVYRPLRGGGADLPIALAWKASRPSPVRDGFIELARSILAEERTDDARLPATQRKL